MAGTSVVTLVLLVLLAFEQGGRPHAHARQTVPSGNVGVVYMPNHNLEYPVYGGWVDISRLRAAIDVDLQILSKYFTHIRTIKAVYNGIELAPIAAKYGLKVYLGVARHTWAALNNIETRAAVTAIRDYGDVVEAVIVGDSVLHAKSYTSFYANQTERFSGVLKVLLDMVKQIDRIKTLAGADAERVKFGTFDYFRWMEDLHKQSLQDDTVRSLRDQLVRNLAAMDILGTLMEPNRDVPMDLGAATMLFDKHWNMSTGYIRISKPFFTEVPTQFFCGYSSYSTFKSCTNNSTRLHNFLQQWSPKTGEATMTFWASAFDGWQDDFGRRSVGYFSASRMRKVADFPRPLRYDDDPIKAVDERPSEGKCAMGLYHNIVYLNQDYVKLCMPSGYNFRNPSKFDERSIKSACKNPFCHLVVHALRNATESNWCTFDKRRMTREVMVEWILKPFEEYCGVDNQFVIDRQRQNPLVCMRSIGDSYKNRFLVPHANGTKGEWCEDVSTFSLETVNMYVAAKRKPLTQEVLESMCFKPSCELMMLQMAISTDDSCFEEEIRARLWAMENILIPFYDGCYEQSQFAADYFETTYRQRKKHPRLPSLPDVLDAVAPVSPAPLLPSTPPSAAAPTADGPTVGDEENTVLDDEQSGSTSISHFSHSPRGRHRPTQVGKGTESDNDGSDAGPDPLPPTDTLSHSLRNRNQPPIAADTGPSTDDHADAGIDGGRVTTIPKGQRILSGHQYLTWIGTGLALIATFALGLFVTIRRRRQRHNPNYVESYHTGGMGGERRRGNEVGKVIEPPSVVADAVIQALFVPPHCLRDILLIGSGGQALVYLVEYTVPARVLSPEAEGNGNQPPARSYLLAAKRLSRRHATTDPDIVRDFLAEIKIVSALRHPSIVRLIGASWTTGYDVQALFEFIPGGDLGSHLSSTPWHAWTRGKLQLALDVMDAIAYVHSLDPPLVHRDIKSRNVLLVPSLDITSAGHGDDDRNWAASVGPLEPCFRAKLTDFGISRRHSARQTMTTGVGTSRWLAPEVILGGGGYDQSCDVYSFGVLLSELDTHRLPFVERQTPSGDILPDIALLQMIAINGVTPAFRGTCPPRLRALAAECLAYEPGERPTAREVATRLRELLPVVVDHHGSQEKT